MSTSNPRAFATLPSSWTVPSASPTVGTSTPTVRTPGACVPGGDAVVRAAATRAHAASAAQARIRLEATAATPHRVGERLGERTEPGERVALLRRAGRPPLPEERAGQRAARPDGVAVYARL